MKYIVKFKIVSSSFFIRKRIKFKGHSIYLVNNGTKYENIGFIFNLN